MTVRDRLVRLNCSWIEAGCPGFILNLPDTFTTGRSAWCPWTADRRFSIFLQKNSAVFFERGNKLEILCKNL